MTNPRGRSSSDFRYRERSREELLALAEENRQKTLAVMRENRRLDLARAREARTRAASDGEQLQFP